MDYQYLRRFQVLLCKTPEQIEALVQKARSEGKPETVTHFSTVSGRWHTIDDVQAQSTIDYLNGLREWNPTQLEPDKVRRRHVEDEEPVKAKRKPGPAPKVEEPVEEEEAEPDFGSDIYARTINTITEKEEAA